MADEEGGTAWMSGAPNSDYGFADFYQGVGSIIAGRKTYEVLASKTAYGFFPYEDKEFICVSSKTDLTPLSQQMSFILPKDLKEQVARLKIESDDKGIIWLAGGAKLASSLIDEGLVDEIQLATLPLLLGQGLSFATGLAKVRPLRLIESEVRSAGVIVSRYQILKAWRSDTHTNMAQ